MWNRIPCRRPSPPPKNEYKFINACLFPNFPLNLWGDSHAINGDDLAWQSSPRSPVLVAENWQRCTPTSGCSFRFDQLTRRCAGRPAAGLWEIGFRTEVSSHRQSQNRPNPGALRWGPPRPRPCYGAPPCWNWRSGWRRGVTPCYVLGK